LTVREIRYLPGRRRLPPILPFSFSLIVLGPAAIALVRDAARRNFRFAFGRFASKVTVSWPASLLVKWSFALRALRFGETLTAVRTGAVVSALGFGT
jgi:hypothetical protein